MANWLKNANLQKLADQARASANTLAQQATQGINQLATQQRGAPRLEGVDPQDADLAAENARLKQLLEDLRAERVDPGDDATAALQHRLQEVLEQSAEKDELLRKATKTQDTLQAKLAMLQSNMEAERAEHAARVPTPQSGDDAPPGDTSRLHSELQDALSAKQALVAQLQELQGEKRNILAGVASPTSQSSTLSGYEGVAHQLEACHQEIKQLQAALAAREADSAQRLQQAQAEIDALQARDASSHAWQSVLDALQAAATSLPPLSEDAALDVTLRALSNALDEACGRLKTPMPNGAGHGDATVLAVQQHVAALLQRLHTATSTAAGAALDLKSAAHTAELDAEQLRQEIIARNQADKGNGGPDSLVQAQLMTLTNEAQQWNERLEAAGAIAAGLQAQVGAFEEECGQLRGTLKELQGEHQGTKEELEAATAQVAALTAQLHAQQESQATDVASVEARLHAERDSAVANEEAARSRVQELEMLLAVAQVDQQRVGELQAALEAAQADQQRVGELQAALEAAQADQQRVGELQAALKAAQADQQRVGELQAALEAAQARAHELEAALATATAASHAVPASDEAASRVGELEAALEAAKAEAASHQDLAMQAVQQLADARSALAAAQAELADAQRGQSQAQAALSDTSKRLHESETQCARAVSRVQDLEAELAAVQQQGSASSGAWEQERASLQERLARLQKVNQTRRQEMDELQAKLVVANNAASNTASLSSEVKALQAQAASLQQQLEAAQAAATDAQQARDALAALAERDVDTSTALQQQLVAAEGRMEAVVRERDMLDEKIGQLRTENKRLNEALADSAALQERLAAAEAAVEAGQAVQARVAQLQGVNERLQREHASVNGMVARLEAKLRQAEDEVEHANAQLDAARMDAAKAARAAAEDLQSLDERDRGSWPAPIRALVEACEAAAASAATGQLAAEADAAAAAAEASMAVMREEHAAALTAAQEAQEARQSLQERLQQLELELSEREASLQQQVASAHKTSSKRAARLEQQLAETQAALDALRSESEARMSDLQARADAAAKEVEEVRGRARALMEDKDATIAALKRASAPPSASATPQLSTGPTPPGSAGGSGAFAVTPAHRHDAGQPPSPGAILVPAHDDGGVAPMGGVSALTHAADAEGGMLPRVVSMERQVQRLQAELEEAEKTNRLREAAQRVLREELAEMRRQERRSTVDVDYLKNVLVSGFESGELPSSGPMFQDIERVKQGVVHHQGSGAWSNLLKAAPKLPSVQLPTMASLRGAGSAGRGVSPRRSSGGAVGGGQGWDVTLQTMASAPSNTK